jgi:predicted SAM-dependent methyltransferase
MNHLPSIRSYIEIVMVRFALMYPQYSVEDPTFVRTLLDPNVKANVASSHLTIAGFVMTKLSSNTHVLLKQRLLEHMSGFLTSNGAHVRCVAQYFIHSVTTKDPQIKAMLPSGILPLIEYLSKNKDTQKVIVRYEEEISKMENILDKSSQGGVTVVLSTPIDVQGEFLSKPFVDKIKELTTEVMSDIRNRGEAVHPVKRENQWME